MQESDIKRLDARDSISETTIHGFRSVLLGAPFLVIGSFSTVLMFKDGVSGYRGDMPFWLLILLTCSFPLAGLLFIGHGLSGLLRQKRTRNLQQRYPNEAWKWDYPWDPAGIKDTSLRRMRKVFRVAIACSLFLLPFNWLAFVFDGPLQAGSEWKLMVGLIDGLTFFLFIYGLYLTFQRRKYGAGYLRFTTFLFFVLVLTSLLSSASSITSVPLSNACVSSGFVGAASLSTKGGYKLKVVPSPDSLSEAMGTVLN